MLTIMDFRELEEEKFQKQLDNKKPEELSSGYSNQSGEVENSGLGILESDKPSLLNPLFSAKEKNLNSGFFKVPRSLIKDPFWSTVPPKYRLIFITLLELACFTPQKFNDHGEILDLKIGQICITERELVEVMGKGFSKNDIHRAIGFFKKCKKVNHEVNHRKSIITITDPVVCYHMINQVEPRTEPILNQSRTTKEEGKKEKKVKNIRTVYADNESDNVCYVSTSKSKKATASPQPPKIFFRDHVSLTQEQFDKLKTDYGQISLDERLDILEAYKGSSGKKYDSDYHTLIPSGWVAKRVLEDKQKSLNGTSYAKTSKRPASESLGDGKPRFQPNILDFSGE